MTRLRPLLALLALITPLSLMAQALVNHGSVDSIVAVVEEDIVLRSELDRAVSNIRRQFSGQQSQLPPADVLERQVLERLIMMRLQIQRATASGVRVSESELEAAVSRVAASNEMTIGQLRMALEADGFSYEEFRQTVREELTVENLRSRVVRSRVEVSDTEVEILLASDSMNQAEIRLSHIMVAVPDGASAEQIALGLEKAEGIVRLIDDGMEFSAAAIRYSDAPQALEGGDLGWRRMDQVPPMFVESVAALEVGQRTDVQRGPGGFHIIKLSERRDQSQFIVTEYNAQHLMIRTSELVSADQAYARIRAARRQIVAEGDFASVARTLSEDDTTAALGGDMGWFVADAYGTGMAMAMQTLQDGELGEPFQSDVGWHLVKRLGTRQRDRTDQVMREQARESIFARKAEEEYESWLRQLRAESYIENRLRDV